MTSKHVFQEDIPYFHEETPSEVKSRLYFENVALERKMLSDLDACNIDEPTRSFCTFSLKVAQLDYHLNEYYDNAAILATQPNPMATMDEATDDQQKIWSYQDGRIKGFADLSLGQKHQALRLVNFVTQEDKNQYKKTMAKLDQVIQKRNRIVHSLFDPAVSSPNKLKLIQSADKKCQEVLKDIDSLSEVFSGYVFYHLGEYYPLS